MCRGGQFALLFLFEGAGQKDHRFFTRHIGLLTDFLKAETFVEPHRPRIGWQTVDLASDVRGLSSIFGKGGAVERLPYAQPARAGRNGNSVNIDEILAPVFQPPQIGAVVLSGAGWQERDEALRFACFIHGDETLRQVDPFFERGLRFFADAGDTGLIDGKQGGQVSGRVEADGHAGGVTRRGACVKRRLFGGER